MKKDFAVAIGAALFIGLWVFVEVSGALAQKTEHFLSELELAVKDAYLDGFEQGRKALEGVE